MTEQNPLAVCEQCGEDKPRKEYCPNSGKHPKRRIQICDDCAAKTPGLIPAIQPEDVPTINPAVPAEETETEAVKPQIKEFKSVPPEPIQLATPKSEPKPEPEQTPSEKLTGVPDACTEPISREEIRAKLAKEESDLNSALESKQRILAQLRQINGQLEQVNAVIAVKKGSVAMSRDILGEKG
jgi:hypothetical protein